MTAAAFDIAVIGGGINGAAIACDAAGRGAKVALIEERDFAEGTSSRSSKLIHGGLRYLETYDFRMVREALLEREILLWKAPHLVTPLRLVLPQVEGQRPLWMIRLGLFLYDHLARRNTLARSEILQLDRHPYGEAIQSPYAKGFAYSDCRGDDSRLVIANVLGASAHGAAIYPRHRFVSGSRKDGLWRIALRNMRDGTPHEVSAKALINAAGPWVTRVAKSIAGTSISRTLRLVKGSHIVVPRQWQGDHGYYLQTSDGRTMEAFPYEEDFTSIGTTDEPWEREPQDVEIAQNEVDYMLAEINKLLKRPVQEHEIIWKYSGVRPLFEVGSARDGNLSALTRDYAFEVDLANGTLPLLTVFGGKLTTHRKLAEKAVDLLSRHLPLPRASQTAREKLPGGDPVDVENRYPYLVKSLARRFARTYGSRTEELLKNGKDLGRDLGAGLHEAEVDFLRNTEWAVTVDDIIWRRTKLGLRMAASDIENLSRYI
jgi:glycerol-3-phosphate dehydrogenase